MQGMVVEGFLALRDAGSPGGLVADFRRARDARAVTGDAGSLVSGGAVCGDSGSRAGRRGALDGERGIVLAGDGDVRDRLQAFLDTRDIARVLGDLFALVLR